MTPPSTPAGLSAAHIYRDGTPQCRIVQVSWQAASDPGGSGVSGYRVYRDGTLLGTTAIVTFADANFLRGMTSYTYQVSSVDHAGNESALSAPLAYTSPPCHTAGHLGELHTAVVLLRFASHPGEPFSRAEVEDLVFDAPYSAARYFDEVSYGRLSLTGSVFGWYDLDGGAADYCTSVVGGLGYNCNVQAIRQEALQMAAPAVGNAERVLFVIHGMGTAGMTGGMYAYFSASASFKVRTVIHELGHTFNAAHAGGWTCPDGLVGPDLQELDGGGCQALRYTDPHDAMGVSIRHYNAYHKEMMGFITPEQVAVAESSGLFTLEALETASSGIKMLEIPLGENNFYFLEYRRPIGFDGVEAFPEYTGGGGSPVEGVQIRLRRDRDWMNQFGDMDTLYIETTITSDAPFVDSYRGLEVRLVSMAGDQAFVSVQYAGGEEAECKGDPDCNDGLYCNGAEFCDAEGRCQPGEPPCAAPLSCDETVDQCSGCTEDSDCDDGVFCNGAEICAAGGTCRRGPLPCPAGQICIEGAQTCGSAAPVGGGAVAPPVPLDSDQDGVPDGQDDCPGTPGGSEVDHFGCAAAQLDDDGDGVTNGADRCPQTPDGQAVGNNGCSQEQVGGIAEQPPFAGGEDDSDGDGVADAMDLCPATPVNSEVDLDGCADEQSDDDGDGVLNGADACPGTPPNERVSDSGCAEDDAGPDGGGPSDPDGLCPGKAAGQPCNGDGDSGDDPVGDGLDVPASPGLEPADNNAEAASPACGAGAAPMSGLLLLMLGLAAFRARERAT